ncbi:MAG: family 43 glycosylhydrolase [Candidatus Methylomirabilis sp.]|nr:family 43 glycosylhydrolase [Deltaproteobacteria bacterium]
MGLITLTLLSACGSSGSGGGAAAPIVYEPHTVLDIPTVVDADGAPDIADPHVLKIGGTWHLYATQTKRDLEVWLSEDLKSWRNAGVAWRPTPGSWNAKGQIWAPHVEPGDGGYYLYYTAHLRIGVAFSASPLGPFEEIYDHPLVGDGYGGVGDGSAPLDGTPLELLDFEEFAIDAFLLHASDGSLRLYFSAYNPFSRILSVPMADYRTTAGAAPVVATSPDLFGWEGFVNEGAWVVERAGRFHLMYSGNFATTVDYAVGVAVADAPQGPFTRYPTNPILRKNEAADFLGPGHHSLAPGAFGDTLIFYHTKAEAAPRFDRRIRYAPIDFGEDGLLALTVPQP